MVALASHLHAQVEAPARKVVVVLGDSLAAGYGVKPEEAYPALLQKKIDAAGWPCTVINAGVSGDTSADGLGRTAWLLRNRMDVLLLELGGNDGLRGLPVSVTQSNLQAIMPPNLGVDYVEAFQKIFSTLAARNHAALVPFLLQDVGGKPELNQEDRIHPNPAGHEIVADNVWRILKPTLESVLKEK
jgi:acyl-CoA thioesterase-1